MTASATEALQRPLPPGPRFTESFGLNHPARFSLSEIVHLSSGQKNVFFFIFEGGVVFFPLPTLKGLNSWMDLHSSEGSQPQVAPSSSKNQGWGWVDTTGNGLLPSSSMSPAPRWMCLRPVPFQLNRDTASTCHSERVPTHGVHNEIELSVIHRHVDPGFQ